MKKVLYRTLMAIALAALVAATGRLFNLIGTVDTSQTMNNPLHYPMLVDTTCNLITYDITDCKIDLACEKMPDTADEMVILCAAAAFTGQCLDTFSHNNILGPHIAKGELFQGYIEHKDDVPFYQRYALFVWKGVDNEGNLLEKDIYSLPNDELLSYTLDHSGMAFTQHWVIKDQQIFTPAIQPFDRIEHFRSICIKQNRIYIIANLQEMPYQQYLDSLIAFGVENALYMDMGAGWNHSFYRDSSNHLHIIHPKAHSYPTNWIVVYK